MPIPFLIVGTAILVTGATGGAGALFHGSAQATVQRSKERFDREYWWYRGAQVSYRDRWRLTERDLSDLGEARLKAYDSLRLAAVFLKKARVNRPDILDRLDPPATEFQAWEAASISLGKHGANVAGAALTGVGTAQSVYTLVGLLGTASTGTAISSLSGAAATNATLAWLGGGSLITGGLGVAGGAAVMGGAVLGPAILASGIYAAIMAEKVKTENEKMIAEMQVAMAEIEKRKVYLMLVRERCWELYRSIKVIEKSLLSLLETSSVSVVEDLYRVAKVAKGLSEVLKTPVIPEKEVETWR
jgi:hypothetical protein